MTLPKTRVRKPDASSLALVIAALLLPDAASAQRVELMSRAAAGVYVDTAGGNPLGISDDGRFVLFSSAAGNVVPGQVDQNGGEDVFLFDRTDGSRLLVSRAVGTSTSTGNAAAPYAAISGDGNWVVFLSAATNHVAGVTDPNGQPDVFLFHRPSGLFSLVSHSAASVTEAAGASGLYVSVSRDGSYVAYASSAGDLVPGQVDANFRDDVFLYRRAFDDTRLVSHAAGSLVTAANDSSEFPVLAGGGVVVAFMSYATNIVAGQVEGNSGRDVFLYDTASGANTLVSHSTAGPATTANYGSEGPSVSDDGSLVAFSSHGTNLVPGQVEGNISSDVFLYAAGTGTVSLVSHVPGSAVTTANGASYRPSLRGDGRVAFESLATNLVLGQSDANGGVDVFVGDTATLTLALVSRSATSATTTANLNSTLYTVSRDGTWIGFTTPATDVITGQASSAPFTTGNAFLFSTATGDRLLASHIPGSATTAGNAESGGAALSGDGAFLAYFSNATNLTSDLDGGGTIDVLVFERATGSSSMASLRDPANPPLSGAGDSSYSSTGPQLSDDGRYAVFTSLAPNLAPGQIDGNNRRDVFLYDRVTGQVVLVSHAVAGPDVAADGGSSDPVISADGGVVVFLSEASNLVAGGSSTSSNVYRWERASGTVQVVSHDAGSTTPSYAYSGSPTISDDGCRVAFWSRGTNQVEGQVDGNFESDVFLWDCLSDASVVVSRSAANPVATGNAGTGAAILSGDGKWVAFESLATDHVTSQADSNLAWDVFLYSRETGTVALVSHAAGSAVTAANRDSMQPQISQDGGRVAFQSRAFNLVAGGSDGNGTDDIFVYDRATTLNALASASAGSPTTAGNDGAHAPAISADGSHVLFRSPSRDLVSGFDDRNGTLADLFLRDLGAATTLLVSRSASGAASSGNDEATGAAISGNGDFVAYSSYATDHVPGQLDANDTLDVFLFSRVDGSTVVVSHVGSNPLQTANVGAVGGEISADGSAVTLWSSASDLVADDLNGLWDAFLYSRICSPPPTLTAVAAGNNRIDLAWASVATTTWTVRRAMVSGGPYEVIGQTSHTQFIDRTAQGGIVYYYVITDGCSSTAEASAVTTGVCQLPPQFAGISTVSEPGASCALSLLWPDATAPCGGAVTYSVYRDESASFVPGPENRVATRLTATSYDDTALLLPGLPYYYIVRALSELNGEEDANEVRLSFTTSGSCTPTLPRPAPHFNVRSGDGENRLDWVNPGAPYDRAHVAYSTLGYPGCGGSAVPGTPLDGSPGERGHVVHGVPNGTTHYYSLCAEGGGMLSSAKASFGRPAATAGAVQWGYTTGATALATVGVLRGIGYFLPSNDRVLHGLSPGWDGGSWPAPGPPTWFPYSMNAPVQGRPTAIQLGATRVGGARFLALVGSQDGRVYAVDAQTGALLWASPVLGAAVQAAPSAMFRDYGGAHDLVLVGTRDPVAEGRFYGLHLATGAPAWIFDNGGGPTAIGVVNSAATVDYGNRRVYFTSRRRGGGSADTVWCLSFTDASVTKLWSADVGDADAAPVLRGGVLYVGNNAGEVHALDPTTGARRWASPYATGDGAVKGHVWRDNATNRLYFSTTTLVHAIRDLGGSAEAHWTAPVGATSPSPVFLLGDRLYWGEAASRVYSIDAVSTSPVAPTFVEVGDPTVPKTVGAPTFDNGAGLLIVGTDLGVVYAVALPF